MHRPDNNSNLRITWRYPLPSIMPFCCFWGHVSWLFLFRCFRRITRSVCYLCPFCLSVCAHGTTGLPLGGFS